MKEVLRRSDRRSADVSAGRSSPAALRARVAYEQKLDGHRALVFTPARPGGTVLMQTRRGRWSRTGGRTWWPPRRNYRPAWSSMANSPSGTPKRVDCSWRCCSAGPQPAPAAPERWPAYRVAFDRLQHDGQELLTRPYADRRTLPEGLFSDHALTAPWHVPLDRWSTHPSLGRQRPTSTHECVRISAVRLLLDPLLAG